MAHILALSFVHFGLMHRAQALSLMHFNTKTHFAGNVTGLGDNSTAPVVSNGTTEPLVNGTASIHLVSDEGEMQWREDKSAGASRMWYDVAMSADGRQRAAVEIAGNIWSSSDAGNTWREDMSIGKTKLWRSVKMSHDGVKRIAVNGNGEIWQSLDAGATWKRTHHVGATLVSVAMDSEGVNVIVAGFQHAILSSNDSGATWRASSAPLGSPWRSVAMSTDGSKLLAAVNGGSIYRSDDGGATWNECITKDAGSSEDTGDGWVAYGPRWISVAMSADGTQQTAVPVSGNIWRSMDSGETWEKDETQGEREWSAVAMSVSGQNRAACVSGGNIFLSVDYGKTWIEEKSVADSADEGMMWYALAMSANGTQQTAAVMKGGLWKRSIPDDEQSFLQLVTNGTHDEVVGFVISWINKHAGNVTNLGDLNAVLEYYSGVKDRKSFQQLADELQQVPWIERFDMSHERPGVLMQASVQKDQQASEEESFVQVVEKGVREEIQGWMESWIKSHGGIVKNVTALSAFVESYIGDGHQDRPSFQRFADELKNGAWIEGLQDKVLQSTSEQIHSDISYAEVVSTGDSDEVVNWVRRWVSQHGGNVTNEGELDAFLRLYMAERGQTSFREIVEELKAATWIEGLTVDLARSVDEQAFVEVVNKRDHEELNAWIHSWIKDHGGRIANEGDLNGLMDFYNGQQDQKSFPELVQELQGATWIEGLRMDADSPMEERGF